MESIDGFQGMLLMKAGRVLLDNTTTTVDEDFSVGNFSSYDDASNMTFDNMTSTNATDDSAEEEEPVAVDSEILRGTFATYGTAFLVIAFIFCVVRQRYPRAFNLRNWVEDRKSDLAKNQYGFISWTWQLAKLSDTALLDECGMDAVCFIRVCTLGLKLCMVGMVCAIFLMPLYFTSPKTDETKDVTDNVVKLTTGHVGPGSPRLIATAIAAYIVFGSCMYLIHKELDEWFLSMRYRFLMKPVARNYAVYLRNIPPHYQSNRAIKLFFERCLGVELLEAHIAMKASNLQKQVASRDTTIAKLEHAVAEEEINGNRPTHRVDSLVPVPVPGMSSGETVDSIDFYAEELKVQNEDISKRISTLTSEAEKEVALQAVASGEEESTEFGTEDEETDFFSFVKSSAGGVVSNVKDKGMSLTAGATDMMGSAVNLLGGEDGEIFSAGFVVFKKLSTVQAALQMTHYEKPYMMECLEAPEPDDIFWQNVGRQHKDLELGRLLSFAATAAACLLWTLPVSFVASLSSVDALRSEIGFIDDMLTAAPFLVPVFEILAPQFLVILNALLPIILEVFTQLEGPISGAMVEASLFIKLALFMIIQTFFVSALSGGIFQELSRLIEDPLAIVDLLATSLPAQATFFMQIALVMTVTTFAIEGLRVSPLALALLRRCIGPNLTEKERSQTFMGLTPLNEPAEFEHADFLSNMVLFFIIFLVYAVIAPLVSFVLAICFIVMGTLFRHQFVYIYNQRPDSGGFLFLNFIKILTSCLLIGEITISGLLALKKAAAATPMMLPLIIGTVLFNSYIRQLHFKIAETLPSRLCLKQDKKKGNMDYSFVEGTYLQPEMQEKEAFPELSLDRLETLGLTPSDPEEGHDSAERTGLGLFPPDQLRSIGLGNPAGEERDIHIPASDVSVTDSVMCRVTKLRLSRFGTATEPPERFTGDE